MRVKNFARIAGDRRLQDQVDEIPADEKRMTTLAFIFRSDGPSTNRDCPKKGFAQKLKRGGTQGRAINGRNYSGVATVVEHATQTDL
jgi:hypothetical protein